MFLGLIDRSTSLAQTENCIICMAKPDVVLIHGLISSCISINVGDANLYENIHIEDNQGGEDHQGSVGEIESHDKHHVDNGTWPWYQECDNQESAAGP